MPSNPHSLNPDIITIQRDRYNDGLPDYLSIRKALRASVAKLLDKDFDLLALGGHEQAIAHRIAVNLERRFPKYNVDCEYNRRKHKAKTRPAETEFDAPISMRPDIIVHRRNSPQNLLAVEMKANANKGSKNDRAKLAALKAEITYLYKGIAFVCIKNDLKSMADGCLRASIFWYVVTPDHLVEQESERSELECAKHRKEVKKILKQRRQ